MADEEEQLEDNFDAEGAEDVGEDGEEGEGKGGKKKLLMILVPVLLLGGGGAAAYFTGMLDSVLGSKPEEVCTVDDHGEEVCEPVAEDEHGEEGDDEHAEGGDDGHGEGGKSEGKAGSAFLPVPPMLVNLKSEDGLPKNFRLKVFLELNNSKDREKVEAILPRVINEFQIYLRELYVKDLRGSAGIYRLKIELLWRVNQAVEPIEIKDVLFQEILIQ